MVSATSDRSVTTNNLFRKRTTPALSLEVMRAIIVGGLGRVPAAVGGPAVVVILQMMGW